MTLQPTAYQDILDLDRYPVDRRADRLRRAFLMLTSGEAFWVAGHGESRHYERFLRHHFPGDVDWIANFDLNGRWIARVERRV